MTNNKKLLTSDEQAHYQSLISLFKYAVTFLAVIGIGIGYLTYSNGQEMREDFKAERAEFKEKINEMKLELTEQKENANDQLERVSQRALNEVSSIKDNATAMAELEARKKIDKVFDDKNFDQFVSEVAEERMKPQINELVDAKLETKESTIARTAVNDLLGQDVVKFIDGYMLLQNNKSIKLTDEQLEQLVQLVETGEPVLERYRESIPILLMERKSSVCTTYFKKQIEKRDKQTAGLATTYYIMHNIDNDYLMDYYLSELNNKKKVRIYFDAIEAASELNRPFTFRLLNSKELADLSSTLEDFEAYMQGAEENLKNNIKESELKATYLFSEK